MRCLLRAITLLAAFALAGAAQAQPVRPGPRTPWTGQVIQGFATVVSGDRIVVNGSSIWLWGVDAPDEGQLCRTARGRLYDCAATARQWLQAYVGDRQVSCDIVYVTHLDDRAGRCFVGQFDLGELMVLSGWALAYRRVTASYAGHEALAQSKQAGFWSGAVEAPWNFRDRRARDPEASGAPPATLGEYL